MTTASRPLRSSTDDSDYSAKLGELRSLLSELAKSAPAAAGATFDELTHTASSLCDGAESGIAKASHAVVKTVKDHPVPIAMAALGAGLLAWWLLSRRGKDG